MNRVSCKLLAVISLLAITSSAVASPDAYITGRAGYPYPLSDNFVPADVEYNLYGSIDNLWIDFVFATEAVQIQTVFGSHEPDMPLVVDYDPIIVETGLINLTAMELDPRHYVTSNFEVPISMEGSYRMLDSGEVINGGWGVSDVRFLVPSLNIWTGSGRMDIGLSQTGNTNIFNRYGFYAKTSISFRPETISFLFQELPGSEIPEPTAFSLAALAAVLLGVIRRQN